MRNLLFQIVFVVFVFYSNYALSQTANDSEIPIYSTCDLTEKKLDSIITLLRDDFYSSNYEHIISNAPALLEESFVQSNSEYKLKLQGLLGNAFIQLNDTESAEDIFTKALKDAEIQKDTLNILGSYINLGNTFLYEQPNKALDYLESAIDILDHTNNPDMVSYVLYNNAADLYVVLKKPDLAQSYLDKSSSFLDVPALNYRKTEAIATFHHTQGAIHLLNKDYKKAIEETKKSLEIGKSKIDENYIINNYQNLMVAYENTKQFKEINEVRKKYEALKEKRYKSEKIKQQQIIQSQFKLDKYQQGLNELRLQNQLYIASEKQSRNRFMFGILTSGLLLIIITILLIARRKRNGLLKDLTTKNAQYLEAKRKSEKLTKSNTKFLSTISHELRTPLYGIIGISSVLLQNSKNSEQLEDIKILKFSADYLLSLVNDILNLNKLSSKAGQKVHKQPIVLSTLVKGILQSFEFVNKQNNNNVTFIIEDDVPEIIISDKTKLSQVLMNLVSNASKFTEEGSISISIQKLTEKNEEVTLNLTIKDNGIGIPLDQQNKIFEDFTQVESNNHNGGTGLGLPIVNKLLKILNSELKIESEVGKGSKFSFNLNVIKGDEQDLNAIEINTSLEHLANKNVLIVDDNKINQIVTKKVLEQYAIKYDSAQNGAIAIEKVKSNSYNAILMDINMPVMDGIEATKIIRKFNKETPIIALTAASETALKNDIEKSGINDIILKPYHAEQLVKCISKHVEI